MRVTVLESWRYADPAEVLERSEELASVQTSAREARAAADRAVERARVASMTPLSPITRRLINRLRIRAAVQCVA